MSTSSLRIACHAGAAAALLLACSAVWPQDAALQPARVPATVSRLPMPMDDARGDESGADVTEEVTVRGRSQLFLRRRVEIAEDKVFALFNDLNTIEEFDIHCRLHAPTGTRMQQRVCAPNYEKELSAEKGQALLAAMRGEAFGTNWQSQEGQMRHKNGELKTHMERLTDEHPELLEALRELYDAMQAADPRRYDDDP
jgi:hypothetical protein